MLATSLSRILCRRNILAPPRYNNGAIRCRNQNAAIVPMP
jgi:hypothetical protein